MKQAMKRSLWAYDETLEMLNIMMEQESLKAMNGRPFRKEKAFRLIQEELSQRGFRTKDAKQIEYRWKNIKKRYVDIQKNPEAEDNASFQYYDEIDLLLNGNGSSGKKVTIPFAGTGKERVTSLTIQKMETISTELKEELAIRPSGKNDLNHTSVDDTFCEDVAMEEEVVEEATETPEATQRRSQRTTKGKNRRYNTDNHRPMPSTPRPTEDEVYRSQKKLLDYQFGLYSRLQRESDEKFMQMSREVLMECNMRFETFVTEALADSELG